MQKFDTVVQLRTPDPSIQKLTKGEKQISLQKYSNKFQSWTSNNLV